MTDYKSRIDRAVDLILEDSRVEGAHHVAWVFDQLLRTLMTERAYTALRRDITAHALACHDDACEHLHSWDEGIAP